MDALAPAVTAVDTAGRRAAVLASIRDGRADQARPLVHDELVTEGPAWLDEQISMALAERDLTFVGELARTVAQIRWGAGVPNPDLYLTIPKLRHDIEQFRHLQSRGLAGIELEPVIAGYERAIERLARLGDNPRVPIDDETRREIGQVYGCLRHVRPSPRLPRALSDRWDAAAIETEYLERPPGVVVVDDFLTDEALAELRAYCLESTLWSGNRYTYGRLGAFLRDGFASPLLLQIAEELRDAMPRVIGDRFPLRQLWGFKNNQRVPAEATIHADFAAVNVNFWITDEEANLDPSTGGMDVYEVDAPLDWDFYSYNGDNALIRAYLERHQARRVTIPYRANRAVIFNSDLFHCTAALNFRPEYEHRRVNITMLYGHREDDAHHRLPPRDDHGGWRSRSFARARGRR